MIYLAIVEITDSCNLRCNHCYNRFDGNHVIKLDEFDDITDQLKQNGCRILRLSGGEPTILKNSLFNYVDIASRKFERVELTTNGVFEEFGALEQWRKIHAIQVSIDGSEPIHNSIRGNGTYAKAWATISRLKNMDLNVNIMMTVGKHNFSDLLYVLEIAKLNDVPMYIERITCTGRAHDNLALSKDELRELFGTARKLGVQTSDPLFYLSNPSYVDYTFKNRIISGCSAGINAICIDAKQDVLPCPRMRIYCGNLKESPLEIILQAPVLQDLCSRDKLTGTCGACEWKWICGGCRAEAYAVSGNCLFGDSGCFYNEKI